MAIKLTESHSLKRIICSFLGQRILDGEEERLHFSEKWIIFTECKTCGISLIAHIDGRYPYHYSLRVVKFVD